MISSANSQKKLEQVTESYQNDGEFFLSLSKIP